MRIIYKKQNTILLLLLTIFCWDAKAQLIPEFLRTEYLKNPLGVDVKHPRFTWFYTGGASQTAYEVLVSKDSLKLRNNSADVWTSRKIKSANVLMKYNGEALLPYTKYFWKVKVWNKGKSSESEIASFETGLVESKNWRGNWITDTQDINLKPAAYFRRKFNNTKKIKSARAYIVAAGLYEFFINGEKVGNHRLDPAFTRFDRRNLYVTHDVTKLLKNGDNVMGVVLGNGWYNHQSTAVWHFDQAPWRARPKFCMDLRIVYDDGSIAYISSDKEWKTNLSPIILNSIYTAEHYDARLESPGWNKPGFVDDGWKSVSYTTAPSQNIVSQQMHPIRDVKILKPVSFNKLSDKNYVYDIGQNIAGVSELTVDGQEGTVVKIIHSERLYKNGKADLSNIDYHYRPKDDKDPFQTDILILSGNKSETFKPQFNYKGFQYVEIISDKPISLTKESLVAYFMHSDVPAVGSIKSSNQVINKIWEATNNSYLSNLFGYPTDCPQREKNGWTGDAHIAIETGLYNFDGITIYEKWLADHRDEQQENGVLPAIIPTALWGYDWANGVDWTSTIAIIPWNIYLFYGDKHLLSQSYESIEKYVNHIDTQYPSGLTDWGLGDWIPIKSEANKELTTSIYYYVDANILAKSAAILGKKEDQEKYTKLANKIKSAINAKFFNDEKEVYGSGLQTELSAALYWGIVPNDKKASVAKKLAERVEKDGRMDVGLLGSKTILNALSENGYADLAYGLASRETYPSWGWWIKNGATSLYENWKIDAASDISLNHIMFGEISAWFYKGIGGMFPDEGEPGFKNIILKPNFVKGLNEFEAKHIGPYGEIISSWKRNDDGVVYQITIPSGSTAKLVLQGKSVSVLTGQKTQFLKSGEINTATLKSGKYGFLIN